MLRHHLQRCSPSPRCSPRRSWRSPTARTSSSGRSRSARRAAPRPPATRSVTTASIAGGSQRPHVIVEHYTATSTFAPVWNDVRGGHARPGARRAARHLRALRHRPRRDDLPARPARHDHVPAHGRPQLDGDRHRGRRHERLCRSSTTAAARASLRLTLWLMWRFHISLPNVIGHDESLTSPLPPRARRGLALPDAWRLAARRHGHLPPPARSP